MCPLNKERRFFPSQNESSYVKMLISPLICKHVLSITVPTTPNTLNGRAHKQHHLKCRHKQLKAATLVLEARCCAHCTDVHTCSLYRRTDCSLYRHVHCKDMFIVQTCSLYRHVHYTDIFIVQTCSDKQVTYVPQGSCASLISRIHVRLDECVQLIRCIGGHANCTAHHADHIMRLRVRERTEDNVVGI